MISSNTDIIVSLFVPFKDMLLGTLLFALNKYHENNDDQTIFEVNNDLNFPISFFSFGNKSRKLQARTLASPTVPNLFH